MHPVKLRVCRVRHSPQSLLSWIGMSKDEGSSSSWYYAAIRSWNKMETLLLNTKAASWMPLFGILAHIVKLLSMQDCSTGPIKCR